MKIEHWIIITGPTIVLLAALMAMAPDEYWDIEGSMGTSSQAAMMDGAPDTPTGDRTDAPAAPEQGGILDNILFMNSTQSPAKSGASMFKVAAKRTVKAQPGVMNFEQAPRVKFSGVVQQVSEFQKRDGQIHVWIHDANGREKEISIAPSWFLKYIGCEIRHDTQVSGVGFSFDNTRPDPMIYARKIRVNGKACRLRNDEGFALWSNRLR